MAKVLCVDIGTSSLKASVIDENGISFGLERYVYSALPETKNLEGAEWINAFKYCGKILLKDNKIDAICVSGNGPSVVCENARTILWNDFLPDEVFALALGESHHVELAHDGEVDVAIVVHQIALQATSARRELIVVAQRTAHHQVEGGCSCRVGGVHGDGEQVFGHDLGVVETARSCQAHLVDILEISNFLTASATVQKQCHCYYNNREQKLFHIFSFRYIVKIFAKINLFLHMYKYFNSFFLSFVRRGGCRGTLLLIAHRYWPACSSFGARRNATI